MFSPLGKVIAAFRSGGRQDDSFGFVPFQPPYKTEPASQRRQLVLFGINLPHPFRVVVIAAGRRPSISFLSAATWKIAATSCSWEGVEMGFIATFGIQIGGVLLLRWWASTVEFRFARLSGCRSCYNYLNGDDGVALALSRFSSGPKLRDHLSGI